MAPVPRYAFILGTHPELSVAELEAVLAGRLTRGIERRRNVAFVDVNEPLPAAELMARLGGTVKIVEMQGVFDEERVADWLFERIDRGSKFHFGFSLYSIDEGVPAKPFWKTIKKLGLQLKKTLKSRGISARFVEARDVVLSSVIVHKERLLKNGVEIVLFKGRDLLQYGQTIAVQPFAEFSRRDYGRPAADAKSGMLPPKVARMMINIAQPEPLHTILDPFCGSGTVLQEALVLGFKHVIGSDLSKKAVNDTLENLHWLEARNVPLHVVDIRKIHTVIKPQTIERVVSEGYLGPPNPKRPEQVRPELRQFYYNALASLRAVLVPGARVVLAMPAWRLRHTSKLLMLDLEAELGGLGYAPFRSALVYSRPDASVLRHIHFLQYNGAKV
jgi:tRNA G10  N-methylase Trm11